MKRLSENEVERAARHIAAELLKLLISTPEGEPRLYDLENGTGLSADFLEWDGEPLHPEEKRRVRRALERLARDLRARSKPAPSEGGGWW